MSLKSALGLLASLLGGLFAGLLAGLLIGLLAGLLVGPGSLVASMLSLGRM